MASGCDGRQSNTPGILLPPALPLAKDPRRHTPSPILGGTGTARPNSVPGLTGDAAPLASLLL
ncbi:hypothetical protein ACWTQZ_25800, partial [Escherichia coli]